MTRTARLRVEPLEDRATPSSGDMDPTFGVAGRIQTGNIQKLAPLPDDRFLAIFSLSVTQYGVARMLLNGFPDQSFGANGLLPLPATANLTGATITALPDGGAFVGWNATNAALGKSEIAVARVTPGGALDATFGVGGVASIQPLIGNGASVGGITVQSDGRVVVAGSQFQTTVGSSYGQMLAARLLPNGQPDTTFGTTGLGVVIATFPIGSFDSSFAYSAAVTPDGRVVLAGEAANAPGTAGTLYSSLPAVLRLLPNGQLDPSFGTTGRVVVNYTLERDGLFRTVSLLPDGRVMLAGENNPPNGQVYANFGVAARLLPNGQLDPTYGSGGLAVSQANGGGPPGIGGTVAPVIDGNGRVVFSLSAFSTVNGKFQVGGVERLTASGVIDTTFGVNGLVTTANVLGVAANDAPVLTPGVALQSDGNIVLGGPGEMIRLIGGAPGGYVPAAAGTVLAGGESNGTVRVLTPNGSGVYAVTGSMSPTPYLGFTGSVRGAVADVTGDGVADYITAAGPGGQPAFSVIDGKTGDAAANGLAFEPTFAGGLFVAAADLDGDGKAEIVATPDQGGGARVVVFSYTAGALTQRASFLGINDSAFRGGARVALGDVTGDGRADLAVSAGFLGGPRTALFNGTTLLGTPTRLTSDFFAFPGSDAQTLRNGVFVAAGDVDGDGKAELIFGGGPGGAPRVFVLSGAKLATGDVAGAQASPVANFFVGADTNDRGGVRVAVKDADGDGKADMVIGSGEGSVSRVRAYLGKFLVAGGEPQFQDIDPFGGQILSGGVFVG